MGRRKGDANPHPVQEHIKEYSLSTPSSTNQQALGFYLELRELPKVDYRNPTDIQNCINSYLALAYKHEMRPGFASLAIAMHTTSQMLNHIMNGNSYRNEQTMALLKEFKAICEAGVRDGMLNAKNPAGFIFELKAMHGWQDVQRIQVEQKEIAMDSNSIQAIEQKYLDSVVVDVGGKQIEIGKPKEVVIDAEAEDLRKAED